MNDGVHGDRSWSREQEVCFFVKQIKMLCCCQQHPNHYPGCSSHLHLRITLCTSVDEGFPKCLPCARGGSVTTHCHPLLFPRAQRRIEWVGCSCACVLGIQQGRQDLARNVASSCIQTYLGVWLIIPDIIACSGLPCTS